MMDNAQHSTDLRGEPPMCVDLDGTLVRTDVLVESWFVLLKRNVLCAVLAPFWLVYEGRGLSMK